MDRNKHGATLSAVQGLCWIVWLRGREIATLEAEKAAQQQLNAKVLSRLAALEALMIERRSELGQ